ncbi:DUF6879 domain-containing protein [Frankia sp. AiPs1]|uniref:DUF6879 family protein n=1 Tax=Frankia sp. AiPa1 TaxID=573492 RepID=UPI00202B9189|nr:DUF6879 family protein [Frankia sp. AiPa1]MCL9758212.1 hypothetical protein [Frankia sp. AiPa1]
MRSLLQRIAFALASGAAGYVLTKWVHGSTVTNLTLAVFIGGAVLIVEFLHEVESGVRDTARTIVEVNRSTQLREQIENSPLDSSENWPVRDLIDNAVICAPPTPILRQLVGAEIRNLIQLMQGLTAVDGRNSAVASCDGEDRNWLLALTEASQSSILATSTTWTDGGEGKFEDGFWKSELGRAYLQGQRAAVRRGVLVQRVFILTDPAILANEDFIRTCEKQHAAGIEVRTKVVLSTPSFHQVEDWAATFKDFILFDHDVSYEIDMDGIQAMTIARTNLRFNPAILQERRDLFEVIWNGSTPLEPGDPNSAAAS